MNKIIYSSNLITLSLLLTACTPTPVPKKVFENSPISITGSQASLGTAIHGSPIQTDVINNNTVKEASQTSRTSTEVVTSVYQEVVEENSIQNQSSDVEIQTTEILMQEENLPLSEEVILSTLPQEDVTQSSKTPSQEVDSDPYGNPPEDYRTSIRNYLSKKANPNDTLKYVFSRPEKAEKKDKSWRGWMVKVDMLKRNGKGEILKNQPYTILFNGSSIVEDIANDNPKNITKVVY
jgi:hypothetical protein